MKWLEELKVRVVYLKDKANDVDVVIWTSPIKQQFEEIMKGEYNPEDSVAAGSPMPSSVADVLESL